MKTIQLSKGKVALVDDEDFERVNKLKWCYSKGYGVKNIRIPGNMSKTKPVLMHRFIMNTPDGMDTDHKDRDGLNNQKSNLRICTTSQNSMNRPKQSNNHSSRFKGVDITINNRKKYYRTQIGFNGKKLSKNFPYTPEGEIQAAKYYNELAKKYHSEFAYLNDL